MGYGKEEGRKCWILSRIWRGRSIGDLVGYRKEKGWKYLILSGIWRGEGKEGLDTKE